MLLHFLYSSVEMHTRTHLHHQGNPNISGPRGIIYDFPLGSRPLMLRSSLHSSGAVRRYRSFSEGGTAPSGQRRSHNWPKNFYYFDWSGVHSLMPKINSKNSEFLYHIVFLAVWWRLSNRIYTFMSGYNRVVWNFTEAKQKKPSKTSARLLRIFKCRLLVDFDSWPQYF